MISAPTACFDGAILLRKGMDFCKVPCPSYSSVIQNNCKFFRIFEIFRDSPLESVEGMIYNTEVYAFFAKNN